MKFRDPKTGEVFEVDVAIVKACDEYGGCGECLVSEHKGNSFCKDWWRTHHAQAARLMVYEVVDENELAQNTGFDASTDTRKEDKPMEQVKKLKDLKPGARKQISKQNILEALQCHGNPYHVCEDCPYQEYDGCSAKLARDTSALIEEMERGKSD